MDSMLAPKPPPRLYRKRYRLFYRKNSVQWTHYRIKNMKIGQTTQIITSTGKIYKEIMIYVATFIGGPLAAGYLIAKNFQVFKDKEKVALTWSFTIITTILFFLKAYLSRDITNLLNQLIPIGYTIIIAFFLVHRFQGRDISEHIKQDRQIYGWGRAICVGLISLAITSLIFSAFYF